MLGAETQVPQRRSEPLFTHRTTLKKKDQRRDEIPPTAGSQGDRTASEQPALNTRTQTHKLTKRFTCNQRQIKSTPSATVNSDVSTCTSGVRGGS